MKAMIENGKIINIVPDNYDAGNPEIELKDIKKVDFTIAENESIQGSCLTEYGATKYYLTATGILKKYTETQLKATREYESYFERKKELAYREESDSLFFKYQAGEIEKQVWLDKRNEIKGI